MSLFVTRPTKGCNLGLKMKRAKPVIVEPTVSYLYGSSETWERYDKACDEIGWKKKTLITQLLHSYGSVHLTYYQNAADMDAIARGFECHQGEHYQLLRDWQELPPYSGAQPAFEPSPLIDVPQVEISADNRRSFRSIQCSGKNSVILNLATIVERSNVPQTLSRIMLWHFDRYWDKSYALQLASDEQQTLSPSI
jgi:hypothetical protein